VTLTVFKPKGEITIISLKDTTLKLLAGLDPKLTAVAPKKFVPEITTLVPPVVLPKLGVNLVTCKEP